MDIYIKTVKKACIIKTKSVLLKDIAEVYTDNAIKSDVENSIIMVIQHDKKCNYVVSNMDVIKTIIKLFPECKVNMVGELDTIIEYLPKQPKENKFLIYIKVIFASIVLFAGAATAIMSFHTDAQIPEVLKNYYRIFFGEQAGPAYIIEVPYSIGLAVGIIVFYNHFFKWKLTEDPTPLQVEMSNYEKDVDDCILDNLSKKKGRTE